MWVSWLPHIICELIDRTTRNFERKISDNKGLNLVSWVKIVGPKIWGGLGIHMI